jgi:hypothetical protein
MDCNDCDMHDLCIPVPGMPGQCTLPAKCEQCIDERMDAVEHEEALLDADLAAMRKDIDAMAVEMAAVSREIRDQTREIAEVKKGVTGVLESSAELLRRAGSNTARSSVMVADLETLKKMVSSIKAEVL